MPPAPVAPPRRLRRRSRRPRATSRPSRTNTAACGRWPPTRSSGWVCSPKIHFEYDRADIREADRAVLGKNADALKRFDFLKVTIEGHADERGTVEYNLALGERRAKAAYDYLVSPGGGRSDRLKTVSYGKEVPSASSPRRIAGRATAGIISQVTSKARP